jgi:hypothetical protein
MAQNIMLKKPVIGAMQVHLAFILQKTLGLWVTAAL